MSVAEKKEEVLEAIQPGIYSDLSNEDYHADKAIGSSGIREFLKCPKLYEWKCLNPEEPAPETPAQQMGSATHALILERKLFDSKFAVAPEKFKDRRTAAWRELAADFKKEGKSLLLKRDYDNMCKMVEVLAKHNIAKNMFKGGAAEQSHFAIDPETGIVQKARPDYLIDDIMIDYKTTGTDLGLTNYSRLEYNMGRHIQSAHHKAVVELTTGKEIVDVLHVVQMQDPPFLIRVFRVSPEWISYGASFRREALDKLKHCIDEGVFPSYPEDEIEDLIMPGFAGYEIN